MQSQRGEERRRSDGLTCRVQFVSADGSGSLPAMLEDHYRVDQSNLDTDTEFTVGAETDCLVLEAGAFRAIDAAETVSLPSVPTVVFSESADPKLAQTVARCDGYDIVYGGGETAGESAAIDRLRDRIDVACHEEKIAETERGDVGSDGSADITSAESTTVGLEETILETAGLLMSAAPDEVDTKIEWGIKSIADTLGADRGVLYERDENRLVLTHQWHAPSADRIEHGEVAAASLPGFEASVSQFEPFRTDELCQEATEAVAEPISALGYGPDGVFIAVPIVIEWTLQRVLVIDGASRDTLSPATGSRLQTAGELIGQRLHHHRQRNELKRQNERLERFASVISHDLQNPLNVITGYTGLVRESDDPDHVDRIENAAERMERMLDDLGTLTRTDEELGELEPVAVSGVANRAAQAVETDGVTIEIAEIGTVEADPSRLQQAFENLLRNAVEHAGTGTTVRFERMDGGLAIVDDGPGFDPEDQGQLFEEGYTGGGGTGLGLAIVRTVIEAHGWTIEATGGEAGGARFEVSDVRFLQ